MGGHTLYNDNTELPLESNGAVPINVQDQTSPTIDLYFTQAIGSQTSIAAPALVDTYTINLLDPAGFAPGQYIGIFSGAGKFYFGTIISLVGAIAVLDTPLDFNLEIGFPVINLNKNMAVNGNITRQIFGVSPGAGTNITIDITRINLLLICNDPIEFNGFGDIAGGLIKGLVLRRNNSGMTNILNLKTTSDIGLAAYDLTIYDQVKQQDINGFLTRLSFGGQSKHGVVLRLSGGDSLEFIIQDDLSSQIQFYAFAEGHQVTE